MTANCPNCGAPVTFRFSNAVQTVCEYCRSILVRHDIALEKVGEVSELPEDPSPIQIGTEGVFRDKSFHVAGRIIYEYELGTWNEWHIVFSDGISGWLSDAQLEYAVTFSAKTPQPLTEMYERGQVFHWYDTDYEVVTMTLAKYRGVEGELPFQYWDKHVVRFLDLRTKDARFGTIDYSENPALVFLGEAVDFDSLRLKNLREFEAWRQ